MKRYGGVSTNFRQMAWICAPEAEKVAETTSVIVRQSLEPIETTGFDLWASYMLARAGGGLRGMQQLRLSNGGTLGGMAYLRFAYCLDSSRLEGQETKVIRV